MNRSRKQSENALHPVSKGSKGFFQFLSYCQLTHAWTFFFKFPLKQVVSTFSSLFVTFSLNQNTPLIFYFVLIFLEFRAGNFIIELGVKLPLI